MTLATLQKGVAAIRIPKETDPVYAFLLERYPPRDIRSKAEHGAYLALVSALMRLAAKEEDERAAGGIRRYLDVLVPFVTRFEEKHWPQGSVRGRDMLAFLMEQHGLNQRDLRDEIGAQPYVSDILKGKKNLTSGQMAKLAKRFHVSPSVFFDD